jgi:hypothetical protein
MALMAAGPALGATATVTDGTPGETPFVVPAGVTSVTVALTGAPGGSGLDPNFTSDNAVGGVGGTASATIAVTPGEVLFLEVGGPGGPGTGSLIGAGGAGGANGGAAGGQHGPAGGGGGATDVHTCSVTSPDALDPDGCAMTPTLTTRLLVAGGGGGGGGSGSAGSTVFGGNGAAAGANGGTGADGTATSGGGGGSAANASTGGAAGTPSGSTAASGGAAATGGTGGDEDGTNFGGGGGGGGGLFGGGGAGGGECRPNNPSVCGAGGGGGGGSSGAPVSAIGVAGVQTGAAASGVAPQASVTWVLPAPTTVTGPISALTSTSAQLNGTVDPNGSHITGCHFTITPAAGSGATPQCVPMPGTGNEPASVAAAVSGLAASTAYRVTLVASSAQGIATGEEVSFVTAASAASSTTTTATTTTTAAPAKLRISAVTQSARSWRAGSAKATISRAAPVGTAFRFTLSRAASVRLAFSRSSGGRRAGGRCVAPTHALRKAARCIRWVAEGTLALAGHAGADTVRFAGRLARGNLRAGAYRVTVSATAGGRKVSARALTFTIVPRASGRRR